MPEFLYDLAVESPVGQSRIKIGAEAGWLDTYRDLLSTAHRISLIPIDQTTSLPVVSVVLNSDRRWIFFSRVYGILGTANQVRLYAIGWQETIDGHSVKNITWVYPNGVIEMADEPSYWKLLM